MSLFSNALQLIVTKYKAYNGNKGNFQWTIKANYPKIYKKISGSYGSGFMNKIYNTIHNISSPPKCKQCESSVRFANIEKGYKTYCSDICAFADPIFEDLKKNAMIAKYGVAHALQIPEINDKRKQTNIEKYGVPETMMKDSMHRKQYENTMLDTYGTLNPMGVHSFRQKISDTWSEKTELELQDIVTKRKQTLTLNYGEHYGDVITSKSRDTLKSRKGHFYPNFKGDSQWIEIDDMETFLLEELPTTHPLQIAKKHNLAFSTVYKAIKKYDLKHLIRKQYNTEYEINELLRAVVPTTTNNRSLLGNRQEIDILIESKKVCIEINGEYWHSENNGKDIKYHITKTILAEDKGYQLIHIFEYEWLQSRNIIESILKSKLGIFETRIYARKCEVRELTAPIKNAFLNECHIQGEDKSSVKLGLFYENVLVGVMTFGKSRYDKTIEWELIRFASALNTQIIGGASKLFSYFIKTYNPNSIISYADRRYSKGGLYSSIGFESEGTTPPNFHVIGNNIHIPESRINWQKHKLKDKLKIFDSSLTAWENMQLNGYDRIWDCGHWKFIWRKK